MAIDSKKPKPRDEERAAALARAKEQAQKMSRQSSGSEERDRISNAQRTAAQLEAAASGDYSKILQGVDRDSHRDVISNANRALATVRGDYERLRRSSDEYKDQRGQDRYMRSQIAKYTDLDIDALLAGKGSTDTSTDTSTSAGVDTVATVEKDNLDKIIASYNHYVETGEDDGGGFVDPSTGLPPGVDNEQEAFLLRTGNFKLNVADMQKAIGSASTELKDQLVKTYGDLDKAAIDMLYGAVGSNADSRDIGKLLAVSRVSSDAFIQAMGVANTQLMTEGVVQRDANGNPIGYAPEVELKFSMKEGQPIATGAGGFNTGLYPARLSSIWVSPEDIQGIVEGDVFNNYKDYYDGYRKQFEFLNDYDFLKMKDFKPIKTSIPTSTSGVSSTPNTGATTTTTTPASNTVGTQVATNATTYTPVTAGTQTMSTTAPSLGGASTGTYPQANVTGTFNTPSQTANLSAVPSSVTVNTNPTGTTMANLTSQSQGGTGGLKTYTNPFGQSIQVTEDAQGNAITYVPPGFTSAAEGGLMGFSNGGDVAMARKFLGFEGPDSQLPNFLQANPPAAARMNKYRQAMVGMANPRMGANTGMFVPTQEQFKQLQGNLVGQTMQPQQANVQQIQPQAADFIGQTAGQAYAVSPFAQVATIPTTSQAGMPMTMPSSQFNPFTAYNQVQAETGKLKPAQGAIVPGSTIDPEQGTSSLDIKAAQGNAIKIAGPDPRKLQTDPVSGESEIISGVANAQTAKNFTEAIQAAEATPSKQATVQGQLEQLMQQFEGGNTPSWAAGSMRNATATMSARGLGASSLAGQAIIQAAMEAALPIAQMDAQVVAQFEAQNLSNRQQRAILSAQQRAQFLGMEFDQAFQARVQNSVRIGEIANMNFTAEQQIALEDARAANTVNLNNLSNRQASVMAEAAALAQLDMANLSNRQQAAVQNAQNFLQMDMTNLSNSQQATMFTAQQNVQALFTDQAAQNAAAQFNAANENQTNQFFASLASQVSQFNASQQNAVDQFNAGQANALREFNSNLQQQRDLFNAQNGLVVAQANAQWRQNLATLNTAAINESNMNFAQTLNALTSTNLDATWQKERDIMSYAFSAEQTAGDRALQIVLADKELEAVREKIANDEKTAKGALWTKLLFNVF